MKDTVTQQLSVPNRYVSDCCPDKTKSGLMIDRLYINAVDCLHTVPLCTFRVQDCNSAIEHGGGPADKVKLNLAMNRVKKMISSSHVKRRHGVGAVGYAVVQPDQRVPDSDFFEPQRMFRVRFRFVSVFSSSCIACCSQSLLLLPNRCFYPVARITFCFGWMSFGACTGQAKLCVQHAVQQPLSPAGLYHVLRICR